MSLPRLRRLAPILLAIPIISHSYFARSKAFRPLTQNESDWINFIPADEEFTVSVPGYPTVRTYQLNNSPDSKAEILAHRVYSGYGSGLIFIIQSFKAERPEKVSNGALTRLDQGTDFERDLFVDGVATKETVKTITGPRGTFTEHNVRLIAGKHLYLMTLATLEATSPAVDRFLSSFRLHSDGQITPIQPPAETTGNVFSVTEVTRRALVIWKSEPSYTEEARQHRVKGTVTLETVFAANGYVTNINVTRGLPNGLTESAIEAARNIRFFPAEKDGKPVSQRTILEYYFDLY